MDNWISILLLAAAVSFDSLAIGITYGMAQIRISLIPRILLSVISASFLLIAMIVGDIVTTWISPALAQILGGLILVLLGAYSLWRAMQQTSTQHGIAQKTSSGSQPKLIYNIHITLLNLVVHVFKQPLDADYDRSNTISLQEALILGFALSLDAFAAGIGAAILGFSPGLTAFLVIIANFIFVSQGLRTGRYIKKGTVSLPLQWLPGAIIIVLGVVKIVA